MELLVKNGAFKMRYAYLVSVARYFDMNHRVIKSLTIVIECDESLSPEQRHKLAFKEALKHSTKHEEFERGDGKRDTWHLGGDDDPGQCLNQYVLVVNVHETSDSGVYIVQPHLESYAMPRDWLDSPGGIDHSDDHPDFKV